MKLKAIKESCAGGCYRLEFRTEDGMIACFEALTQEEIDAIVEMERPTAGATCPEIRDAFEKWSNYDQLLSDGGREHALCDLWLAVKAQMKYAPPKDAGIPREKIKALRDTIAVEERKSASC